MSKKRTETNTAWHQYRCRNCQYEVGCNVEYPMGLQILYSGFSPEAFPLSRDKKPRKFEIRILLLLHEVLAHANDFYQPNFGIIPPFANRYHAL